MKIYVHSSSENHHYALTHYTLILHSLSLIISLLRTHYCSLSHSSILSLTLTHSLSLSLALSHSSTLSRTLFTASFVLLPLLGLTWVFGLLSVNQETSFFAWIFTVLNSLQVWCSYRQGHSLLTVIVWPHEVEPAMASFRQFIIINFEHMQYPVAHAQMLCATMYHHLSYWVSTIQEWGFKMAPSL